MQYDTSAAFVFLVIGEAIGFAAGAAVWLLVPCCVQPKPTGWLATERTELENAVRDKVRQARARGEGFVILDSSEQLKVMGEMLPKEGGRPGDL